MLDSGTMS